MATLHTEEDGTLRLTVELADDPYDVSIGDGVRSRVGSVLRERFPTAKSVVVVTDSTVGPLYAKEVTDSLSAADFLVHALETPAGESSKSMDEVTRICRAMLQMGCDRKSLLVALGGGVVGDLAGFCASIFQRGIPYLQMPTTIVSQVDSSVGGKTGVNTAEGKNLLGAFHQPCHVLADTETLRSLPPREYREGFAEVIKHAAIRNGELLAELSKFSSDSHGIAPLIAENVRIKATIVEEDERETSGTRALLNFGHTIGHGIEAAAGYGQLLHGEAISLGLRAALRLSLAKFGLSSPESQRVEAALDAFDLPAHLPPSIRDEDILQLMTRDKKFESGKVRFVLLRSLGDAELTSDVTWPEIEEQVRSLRATQ